MIIQAEGAGCSRDLSLHLATGPGISKFAPNRRSRLPRSARDNSPPPRTSYQLRTAEGQHSAEASSAVLRLARVITFLAPGVLHHFRRPPGDLLAQQPPNDVQAHVDP